MKHKRLSFFISFLMLSAICLSSCENADIPLSETSTSDISEIISQIETGEMDFSYSDRDQNPDYDAESATLICFSDSGSTVTGNGASASGTDVTITAAGTYLLTGTASDAVLTVSASKTDKIQLVLNGLSLSCTDGPAVYIQSADKVFITLAENSENFLSDGNSYEITDDGSTLDAALFSKEDLTINGTGKLTVIGNYKHGIVSKDDLVVTGGILSITSVKVGLCGKDCVKINAGEITIDAGSDGIRSDNDEDTSCGYVYISGGTLHITAGNDGIQAETVLNIETTKSNETTHLACTAVFRHHRRRTDIRNEVHKTAVGRTRRRVEKIRNTAEIQCRHHRTKAGVCGFPCAPVLFGGDAKQHTCTLRLQSCKAERQALQDKALRISAPPARGRHEADTLPVVALCGQGRLGGAPRHLAQGSKGASRHRQAALRML